MASDMADFHSCAKGGPMISAALQVKRAAGKTTIRQHPLTMIVN